MAQGFAPIAIRQKNPMAGIGNCIKQIPAADGFVSLAERSKLHNKDPIWQTQVDATRAGVMKTIRAIKAGEVDELDIERLQNFCLFSLALMQAEGSKKWARAKLNAELMSLMKGKE